MAGDIDFENVFGLLSTNELLLEIVEWGLLPTTVHRKGVPMRLYLGRVF